MSVSHFHGGRGSLPGEIMDFFSALNPDESRVNLGASIRRGKPGFLQIDQQHHRAFIQGRRSAPNRGVTLPSTRETSPSAALPHRQWTPYPYYQPAPFSARGPWMAPAIYPPLPYYTVPYSSPLSAHPQPSVLQQQQGNGMSARGRQSAGNVSKGTTGWYGNSNSRVFGHSWFTQQGNSRHISTRADPDKPSNETQDASAAPSPSADTPSPPTGEDKGGAPPPSPTNSTAPSQPETPQQPQETAATPSGGQPAAPASDQPAPQAQTNASPQTQSASPPPSSMPVAANGSLPKGDQLAMPYLPQLPPESASDDKAGQVRIMSKFWRQAAIDAPRKNEKRKLYKAPVPGEVLPHLTSSGELALPRPVGTLFDPRSPESFRSAFIGLYDSSMPAMDYLQELDQTLQLFKGLGDIDREINRRRGEMQNDMLVEENMRRTVLAEEEKVKADLDLETESLQKSRTEQRQPYASILQKIPHPAETPSQREERIKREEQEEAEIERKEQEYNKKAEAQEQEDKNAPGGHAATRAGMHSTAVFVWAAPLLVLWLCG